MSVGKQKVAYDMNRKSFFGTIDGVEIEGDLTKPRAIANITFVRVNRHNEEEEVTITITKESAERLKNEIENALDPDFDGYVHFR